MGAHVLMTGNNGRWQSGQQESFTRAPWTRAEPTFHLTKSEHHATIPPPSRDAELIDPHMLLPATMLDQERESPTGTRHKPAAW
eukprot:5101933-Amphidinium_carterae.1